MDCLQPRSVHNGSNKYYTIAREHSIQNALVNNDDALVNVIKQSLNLKFAKSKKVSQDYLLTLVQEKKASRDFNAETFIMLLLLEPKGKIFLL